MSTSLMQSIFRSQVSFQGQKVKKRHFHFFLYITDHYMTQSSVTWHGCMSIWGISFHDDLCSNFKVIQALQGGIFVFAVANAALVKDAELIRHLYCVCKFRCYPFYYCCCCSSYNHFEWTAIGQYLLPPRLLTLEL